MWNTKATLKCYIYSPWWSKESQRPYLAPNLYALSLEYRIWQSKSYKSTIAALETICIIRPRWKSWPVYAIIDTIC